MGTLHLLLSFTLSVFLVNCAVILDDDVEQQGLYSKSDHVTILTGANFDRNLYGKRYAQVVQFYNSYCGHCRNFYPKYRIVAFEVIPWNKIFRLAVIDCFNEDNNEICRDFEVMSYPSLRYVHENYVKGNGNVGEKIDVTDTPEKLKSAIIKKLISEQQVGRFSIGPTLDIASHVTTATVLQDVPSNTLYTFLIFEDTNSTVGSELALDISGYRHLVVKRVHANSELAHLVKYKNPGLAVVGRSIEPSDLTPKSISQHSMLQTVNMFLKSHNYDVPKQDIDDEIVTESSNVNNLVAKSLKVYYSDLEKTLRSILHTEINTKVISGESHTALVNLLEVLKNNFPYKGNTHLQAFLEELLKRIQSTSTWQPTTLNDLIRTLENKHNPYKSKATEYIGCKGSQPKYRGYTCGLWTMFHTLTVSAVPKSNSEGSKVLRAMHGFVTHFFGCTYCVQHFLKMASTNKIFDVKDNDRAVLWLWVSHNEVNLRLAGDPTEDPQVPKIQFPSVSQCPQCRLVNGAWKLPDVYQYLLAFYTSENIVDEPSERSSAAVLGQLSNLDMGMLSLLYIFSFIIIILILKFFLTKRFYRKRIYKHGRGKV